MSRLYDRIKLKKEQAEELVPQIEVEQQSVVPTEPELPQSLTQEPPALMDMGLRLADVNHALALVDDVVLKKYLTRLSDMSVIQLAESWDVKDALKEAILFKVNKMVYEKDEYATEKFNSIISAMTYTTGSVFMIVDGYQSRTDFYLGVKFNTDSEKNISSYADTLQRALLGQFPGAEIKDLSVLGAGEKFSQQELLMERIKKDTNTISICSGVPAFKNSKGEYTNATFVQGIEKFATAMSGKRYTAIILATNVPENEIGMLRQGYEDVYTQLSATATQQLAYSTNESLANAISRSKGVSEGNTITNTTGESVTTTKSTTHTDTQSTTHTEGETKDNSWGRAAKYSHGISAVGAMLTATGFGAPAGVALMATGAVGAIVGSLGTKQLNKSDSTTTGASDSTTEGESNTTNRSTSEAHSHTESFTETNGQTSTIGTTKNFTLTIQDKHIQEIQKRIDRQLERMAVSESTGLWATCAYFLSYDNDRATAESGAAIYRSIVQGEQSGVEQSAISTWYSDSPSFEQVHNSVCSLTHPVFAYNKPGMAAPLLLPPTNMLSSKEVAMMLALPRKSVPGFPVVEHISLGKEVVRLGHTDEYGQFQLGCIFDQGIERQHNKVLLDTNSLSKHTFVTGSTGCGKSETVYKLIDSIRNAGAKFLIIEPAKGEYKNVFGTEHIFGTNPLISNLLKINPFKFPEGVHVLEHADRLIEIFNVCWPMYAAMPAVLKEAVLNAYEDCGWDLIKSTNKYAQRIFPTFSDLILELEAVIELSDYSEEVKSNYKGSLVTRVKSLANGINGEIFSGIEIGDQLLFDENVIVDISRIGSQETKALIMGILIMRLNEYRANSGLEANSKLRHVTILEEAHNLLKRCSQEQSAEGSNVAGKSVEMISNAIAEMRTYGEGFIIVDQSPGAVDISAIRNTNTKIIMRLPEESDRKVAGKSASMKDSQIDEIAKLPTGVAVVYQNDWEEPVLCKVEQFSGNRLRYEFKEDIPQSIDMDKLIVETVKFMFQAKTKMPQAFDIAVIKKDMYSSTLPTSVKINVLDAVLEYEATGKASIWEDVEYVKFSGVISWLFGVKQRIIKLVKQAPNYDVLTANLKTLIHEKVKGLPRTLDMPILQSLLRDYSTGDDSRLHKYSEWVRITRDRMK